ncbi:MULTISPECIES: glycine cleavage system protein GcvH [unclassified Siphonobacter]|uniref:glycine cleavage system protein GcvH n=1 Tax=unclassified Siphonobacter TaxID=2635712 RepID=UPI000CAC4145|nr:MULTISPECIES: glycine cleavage system protein GcvH [unclassified Siphonobacter]MDQ1087588.1 glycine cleavage system H protein [Siphonobacter sp. SORGH_AS_1065]MDR6193739.1 glycine cleavage system H protein [Siphonobacter sp. SORGH_AS_0500]PKK37920.1 glycine cleavage system protein H [Siphonobacter sp. SORGH_AS_0500]
MNFPADLRYTTEHEWIKLVDGNVALIGITDYAQDQLGDVVFVEVNSLNEELAANEVFGSVEAVKTVSDLFLPVAGKVLEVNESLNDNPDTLNSDPYGEGWIIKLEVNDPADLDNLMDAATYQQSVH